MLKKKQKCLEHLERKGWESTEWTQNEKEIDQERAIVPFFNFFGGASPRPNALAHCSRRSSLCNATNKIKREKSWDARALGRCERPSD